VLLAERLTAQLLAGPPAKDAPEVAGQLLAVQAQDPRGVRLAIRARTEGITASDVDRALTDDRSVVIQWLNRGTLHLVAAEDHFWLHALTTPPLFTANARRLAQEGVSQDQAERAVKVIERALTKEGPLTRSDLSERLTSAGVPVKGQALIHELFLASLRGLILRGPMIGGHQAFALTRDWLGPPPRVDREVALAELARRFLRGHGPADERDLAKWAGLPLRDARAGLSAIGDELSSRTDGLVDLKGRAPAEQLPAPRLLGSFEPLLLGWVSRAPVLGEHQGRVTVEGLFRSFALVRGRAAATWRIADGEVVLEPFRRIVRADREALDADAADVQRFLGRAPSDQTNRR